MSKSKKIFSILLMAFVVFSCHENKRTFRYDGGELKFPITSAPLTWIPCEIIDQNTQTVLSQIYEPLIELDPYTFQIKPLIAQSFSNSSDYTEFTFIIRNDVYFHSKKGREFARKLKPNDIVKTFEFYCKRKNSAAYQNVLYNIRGTQEYKEGKAKNISGIVIQDSSLTILLNSPNPLFLSKLASVNCSILSSSWLNNPKGIPDGTGPFYLKHFNSRSVKLERNSLYYLVGKKDSSLPYLNRLTFNIYHSQRDATKDFLNHKLDIITNLNISNLGEIFQQKKADFNTVPPKLIYKVKPLLQTTLIIFNLNNPILKPAANRRIFNYAINRSLLPLDEKSEDNLNYYGLTPSSLPIYGKYEQNKLELQSLNYSRKYLMANANKITSFSKDTLVLALSNNQERIKLARAIQHQLFNELHIVVQLKILPFDKFVNCLENRKADLFLTSLVADFSNPLSLMNYFYSGGNPDTIIVSKEVNFSRYHNWYFDQFFERATSQFKSNEQINSILLAEKELMKDPPFIALNYNKNNYVYYSYVCGFAENLLNNAYFRECYIKR